MKYYFPQLIHAKGSNHWSEEELENEAKEAKLNMPLQPSQHESPSTTLKLRDTCSPIIEYCSLIWSPYLIPDIKRIENVQKYFIHIVLRKVFPGSYKPDHTR